MTYQLLSAIEQVSREKNIEADVIITALEEAIVADDGVAFARCRAPA